MAKGSQFWGNASGKLGQQVLYRAGGEQRARTYVPRIKNPRTLSQARNRLSMRNFASLFRAFKDVFRLSFPLRPTKESGFNALVKANKTVASAAISPFGMQQNLFVPYDMTVSKGNLGVIPFVFTAPNEDNSANLAWSGGTSVSSYPSNYVQLLLSLNFSQEEISGNEPIAHPIVGADRISAALEMLGMPAGSSLTILQAEYADEGWERVSPDVAIVATWDGSQFTVDFTVAGTQGTTMDNTYLAVIVSKKTDGKLDVTTSKFMPMASNHDLADSFLYGGDVYAESLEAYVKSSDVLPTEQ